MRSICGLDALQLSLTARTTAGSGLARGVRRRAFTASRSIIRLEAVLAVVTPLATLVDSVSTVPAQIRTDKA